VDDFGFDLEDFRLGDFERVGAQAEETLRKIEEVRGELESLVGTGQSANGQITVIVTAGGRVQDVTFAPRVMRLDSQALAREVLLAMRQAQDDAERRARELMDEALGESFQDAFDPEKVQERFTEMLESFTSSMDGHDRSLDRTRDEMP
jgi:Uncharacterized protein conserved in bacteria